MIFIQYYLKRFPYMRYDWNLNNTYIKWADNTVADCGPEMSTDDNARKIEFVHKSFIYAALFMRKKVFQIFSLNPGSAVFSRFW